MLAMEDAGDDNPSWTEDDVIRTIYSEIITCTTILYQFQYSKNEEEEKKTNTPKVTNNLNNKK